MGVPKLNSFMLTNAKWDSVLVRGKVVIDGTALCYNLNSCQEWRLGGNYKEFYDTVSKYFSELSDMGIKPYVVLDGMDSDDSKYDTYIKRNEERINHIASCQLQGTEPRNIVRPLFTQIVFVDVLRDNGVPFFIADGEADHDIAALANGLSCPVISNDSDFYIFNIEAGYIPLGNELLILQSPVKCYKYRDFDTFHGLHCDQRLYIPFLLGNDFHSGSPLAKLCLNNRTPLKHILTKIKQSGLTGTSDSELEHFQGNAVEIMKKLRSQYRVAPRSFEDLASTRLLQELYPKSPHWIFAEYKKGRFMAPIMSLATTPTQKRWRHTIVIEDFRKPSAWNITSVAKKFIIGGLLGDQECNVLKTIVVQSPSGELSLSDKEIKPSPKHLKISPAPLQDIPKLAQTERKQIIHRVFHYTEPLECQIPEDLQLVLIATHSWIRNKAPDTTDTKHLVQSLICCIVTCSGHFEEVTINTRSPNPAGDNMLTFLHAYAQWQCLLHHIIAFNQVLGHPFPYTSPAKLFSGSILLHFYQQDSKALLTIMENSKIGMSMFNNITKGFDFDCEVLATEHSGSLPRKRPRFV